MEKCEQFLEHANIPSQTLNSFAHVTGSKFSYRVLYTPYLCLSQIFCLTRVMCFGFLLTAATVVPTPEIMDAVHSARHDDITFNIYVAKNRSNFQDEAHMTIN